MGIFLKIPNDKTKNRKSSWLVYFDDSRFFYRLGGGVRNFYLIYNQVCASPSYIEFCSSKKSILGFDKILRL